MVLHAYKFLKIRAIVQPIVLQAMNVITSELQAIHSSRKLKRKKDGAIKAESRLR